MNKKIGIIGVGNVGATLAYTLAIKNVAKEIVLIDIDRNKTTSNCYDIQDASPNTNIYVGDYSDLLDADIIVNCTGSCKILFDKDRMSEFTVSKKMAQEIINNLNQIKYKGVLLNVANPNEQVSKLFFDGLKYTKKVYGTGTALDTARAQTISKDSNCYVVGVHENSDIVIKNNNDQNLKEKVVKRMREICSYKGCTNFGISNVTANIIDSILNNKNEVHCISMYNSEKEKFESYLSVVGKEVKKHG